MSAPAYQRPVTIALDACGGDHGTSVIVAGAARLSLEGGDVRVLLVGPNEEVQRALSAVPHDPRHLAVVDAGPAVPMDAHPREALEADPRTSVLRACQVVAAGEADAVVSAGNTGATVLAAASTFQRLPGIRRAALASVFPTQLPHGPRNDPFGLILDVGATLTADADTLLGFAVLGSAYSSIISEIQAPRVGLLSNGHEPLKGTPAIVEAHRRLSEGSLNFAGNVEGLDIPRGEVDVVVCDGFLGNVVLKMLEGVGDVLESVTSEAAARHWRWRIGLTMLQSGLRRLRDLTDFKVYGGAPLLGLDHVVIKAHGRSEAGAVRNALKVAAKAVRGDLVRRTRESVTAMGLDADGGRA